MSSKTIILDKNNFQSTIQSGTSLVDFWAEWCGPCKMQGPIIDQVAEIIGEKINICKLDTDKNTALAEEYEITSIPSILIFKNGKVVERMVGLQPKEKLLEVINSI